MDPVQDPKSKLNMVVQRMIGRPVSKEDVIYATAKYPGGFQATVTLNCIDGQSFAGDLSSNQKDAEKNAAMQVLEFYKDEVENLSTAQPKNKKRKAAPAAPAAMFQQFDQFGTDEQLLGLQGHEMDGAPPSKQARIQDPFAGAPAADLPKTHKADLNTFCSKVMRRVMEKGEVAYETCQVVGGFQATVRCQGLPGESAEMVWAGEVCAKKVDAEQAAAGIALSALTADAELVAAFSAPPKQSTWTPPAGKGFGKGFGKGKDKGKGKGGGKPNFWAPQGQFIGELDRRY